MGFLRLDAQSDPTFATTMKQHARKAAQLSPPKHEKELGCEYDQGINTKTTQHNEVMEVRTPVFYSLV